MNKIIAAFDGLRFSESTLQYAIYMAKHYSAQLTGVFLRESTSLGYAVYTMLEEESLLGENIFTEIEKEDKIAIGKAIENFETACQKANLRYTIHSDNQKASGELLNETLFADLMIIDASESFSYLGGNAPSSFIKNILHETHCPVLLVPRNFSPIEKLALLYDGNAPSLFAIKMLSYVMPGLAKLQTKVIYATKSRPPHHLPHDKFMREWMQSHFSSVTYQVLPGDTEDIISIVAKESERTLVVAGSYHRSTISMWLNQSLADPLLRKIKAPIFIAHG
jgi:nucleotide-binding universal stress UspA family protein